MLNWGEPPLEVQILYTFPEVFESSCRSAIFWFQSPMREHTVLCTIRSLAQTLCYDLARAEKAKDGKKCNLLVSMKFCGLWRLEEQLARPFWAKPVLRRLSRLRIGSVGASYFVDDFVSFWGKRGGYRLLLEHSSLLFLFRLVAWLFAAKRRRFLQS